MARFFGGGSGGPDYVQPDEPADPESPERWYDTDADPDGDGNAEGAMKVYGTDGNWHTVTIDDHGELGGVLEDNHHNYPIPTSGLATDAVTAAKIAAGAVGSGQIADSAVTLAKLGFDTATQSELDDHTGDTTNPHNVSDDQTGAADALSNHAGDATAHHLPPEELLGTAEDSDDTTAMDLTVDTSSDTYRAYRLVVSSTCEEDVNVAPSVQINGISTTDYTFFRTDENSYTKSHFEAGLGDTVGRFAAAGEILIIPHQSSSPFACSLQAGRDGFTTDRGYGPGVSDVDSVRWFEPDGYQTTGEIAVYGRT